MNKTKIEWCDMTWNPVTGCLHGCYYCYAIKQVRRFKRGYKEVFCNGNIHSIDAPETTTTKKGKIVKAPYPFGFEPTFHRHRLDEPKHIKKPQNIFVCDMADLFGDFIPNEWIRTVFKACEAAPQHRYLFLTKNPKRYEKFINSPMPNNMWFGFSQTKDEYIGFDTNPNWNVFVSMEPLLCDLSKKALPQGVDWVIIGAETGNQKGKIIPERCWIENIIKLCKLHCIPVFMKDSLAPIWGEPLIREYPWKTAENAGGRV